MADCKAATKSLSDWFETAQGRYVLKREQAYFDRAVGDIFGFNALQIGLPELDFLRTSRIPLRFTGGKHSDNAVRLINTELPLASDSLDLVVLPHVLEFSDNPHQTLREIERVLRAEGSLVISGFNPFSLWGLYRPLGRRRGYPWQGKFLTLTRLKDWLALLGFEIVGGRFAAYAPPFHQRPWLERYSFLEKAGDRWWAVGGGVYFLHAIKRVPSMRPLKPQWNERLVRRWIPATPKLNRDVSQCEPKND